MKVLFWCENKAKADQLTLALRMRWPDLNALFASRADLGGVSGEPEEPDLVMLCPEGPDLDVSSAIRHVRGHSDVPIVVAADGGDEMDAVKALELGADDYIRLSSSMMEIVARVAALMRRVGITKQRHNGTRIECGDLLIDPSSYEVFLHSHPLDVTPTEFKLLYLLAKNRHVTLSQRFIQRIVWAGDVDAGETLKKYVQRLRRKLGDDARNPTWIKTVHGVGYRFTAPAPSAA